MVGFNPLNGIYFKIQIFEFFSKLRTNDPQSSLSAGLILEFLLMSEFSL